MMKECFFIMLLNFGLINGRNTYVLIPYECIYKLAKKIQFKH